jgi:biotin carboxylase
VTKKRILVVFPTAWDERQLAALPAAVRERYELVLDEPRDEDVRWDFDVLGYVEARARAWRGRIDGVTSCSDYPGAAVAAALAESLALPGAGAESVLRASHKYHSRQVQRAAAPEAVPDFELFDPADERSWPARFPCFVKPVKGSFSLFARRIQDREELRAFARTSALAEFRTHYQRLFHELCARHARLEQPSHAFLAEEPLGGAQATVEGWIDADGAHVLGVVDTLFHPGTTSFAGFHYPSLLPDAVQERMGRVACDVARALGLGPTLFNAEFFNDVARGRVSLIEINPRPCGQFGDLYLKVDGTHGAEVALALASGATPAVRRGAGSFRAAASIPLRVFRTTRLERAPAHARQREVERRFPGTLVWCDSPSGEILRVANDVEDGQSVRYGVVNLGGASRSDIQEKLAAITRELAFELAPVEPSHTVLDA